MHNVRSTENQQTQEANENSVAAQPHIMARPLQFPQEHAIGPERAIPPRAQGKPSGSLPHAFAGDACHPSIGVGTHVTVAQRQQPRNMRSDHDCYRSTVVAASGREKQGTRTVIALGLLRQLGQVHRLITRF